MAQHSRLRRENSSSSRSILIRCWEGLLFPAPSSPPASRRLRFEWLEKRQLLSGTTLSETLTGLNQPDAMAFDSSGDLFVTNSGGNTVTEYAPGSDTPSAILNGLLGPDALAFDSSGNLYVANYDGTTVSKFSPGSLTPSATLTGVENPDALAVDSSGDLFVANLGNDTISKFAAAGRLPEPSHAERVAEG